MVPPGDGESVVVLPLSCWFPPKGPVINSFEIAVPNDVIAGIEEIDTIRVHD